MIAKDFTDRSRSRATGGRKRQKGRRKTNGYDYENVLAHLTANRNDAQGWAPAGDPARLETNPQDVTARFNLSIAYSNIGEHEKAVEEFEQVENSLSFRTLWYQIEPLESYFELGNYDRVIEISDRVLNYHNRAFSELYILKGNIYLKRGNKEAARSEFQKAVQYNKNLESAQEALKTVE